MLILYPVLFGFGLLLSVGTALRKGSCFYSFVGTLVAIYGGLHSMELFTPPLPDQVVQMYLLLSVFFLLMYHSITDESLQDLLAPIESLLVDDRKKVLRVAVFVLLPLFGSYLAHYRLLPRYEPPVTARIVHPEPPTDTSFRGKRIMVVGLENPLRRETDRRAQYLEEGKRIYYENCFFCHGDILDGKGHLALGFNPLPLPFRGMDTIAQLPESLVFFRVAKGWSGLPEGSHPWDSAMPIWEEMLSEAEIWKVILYVYEATGNQPRTWQ